MRLSALFQPGGVCGIEADAKVHMVFLVGALEFSPHIPLNVILDGVDLYLHGKMQILGSDKGRFGQCGGEDSTEAFPKLRDRSG